MSDFQPAEIPSGIEIINGAEHMRDAKGALVPKDLVKPQHQLEDETVRKVMGFAVAISEQVARFKTHCLEDLDAFEALLAQEYNAKLGGAKGNKQLVSYDGLLKIQVQNADYIDFGPELQIAKGLIDDCLNEWVSESGPELRAIVTRAFNTDKPGQINKSEIFTLLRLEIEDARWQRAMKAIRDAMRVVHTKEYIRFYRRDNLDAPWQPITTDMAKA